MESAKEVMAWFKLNKLKIPMISHLALIIHVIPPSQIENERDFSLAVVIACAKQAALSAENLAMILFINKNKNIGSKETVGKLNIFEDDFAIIEDDIDVVEEFIKENGEVDEEVA